MGKFIRKIKIVLGIPLNMDEYIEERKEKGVSDQEIANEAVNEFTKSMFGKTYDGEVNLDGEDSDEQKYKWSAIMLEDTCEDCRKRNGQVKTWEEWEEVGLPNDGKTKCGEGCRCVLISEDVPTLDGK